MLHFLGLVKRADPALPDVLLRDLYLFARKIFRPRDVLPSQRLGRVQPARLLQSGTLAMKIICCETFILMMGNTFLNCVKIDSFLNGFSLNQYLHPSHRFRSF